MTRTLALLRSLLRSVAAPAAALALMLMIAGSTAQTPPPNPTVDLSVGPVATSTEAVNVALALSVEFPTVGSPYKANRVYDHSQTFLGYWDATGCYTYFDEADTSALAGQYFRRTGSVDASGYCNGGGRSGEYSGNLLNFAATSTIDILRYALTGGHRLVDTASSSVLGRAYLYWKFSMSRIHETGSTANFPEKTVPPSLVGKVTPQYQKTVGTGNYTGTVYVNSCADRIYFGEDNVGGDCAVPAGANSFGPSVPNLAGGFTTQGFAVTPVDNATTTYVASSPAVAYWAASTSGATQTFAPSGTDALAGVLDPATLVVSPTPRNKGVVSGTASTPQYAGDPVVGVAQVAGAGTTTVVPPAAAEATPVVRGYYWTGATATLTPITAAEATPVVRGYYRTGATSTTAPIAAAENPPTVVGLTAPWTASTSLTYTLQAAVTPSVQTFTATQNHYICYKTIAPYTLNYGPSATNPTCASGYTKKQFTSGTAANRRYYRYYTGTKVYHVYAPFYRAYAPYYTPYTATSYYNIYPLVPTWYVPNVYTVYKVFSNVTQTRMRAAVQVCGDLEKTTRTDLCQRYPDGNYKPVGEVQRKGQGLRLAAFGYLNEIDPKRYGGVLRAPMKYPGPNYIDTSGNTVANASSEWNANNGVFSANPLADATYPYSGVTNYLNRFGTLGTQLGNYKQGDPVGELYYETLRYFQGLGPTPAATTGLNAALEEGYPVYTTTTVGTWKWQDPLQNACQRNNYILVIGDENNHYDKHLPGHGSLAGLETTIDPARAAEPVPGTTTISFSAVSWTQVLSAFETGASRTYTDAYGRSQNTLGNTGSFIIASNSSLETKSPYSSNAYYWAGAAYWANTQPVRHDLKGTPAQSMKDVRVKTFVVDVDDKGNGSYEDDNPGPTKPRKRVMYLAGKYGWFKDTSSDGRPDGNPFKSSADAITNAEWQDPALPNTPDGYVLAGQSQKMIDGVRKFFDAVNFQYGAASVSAVSSARYTAGSPNGDIFTPKFGSGDWSGTVQRTALLLNTASATVEAGSTVIWDAGVILTAASTAGSATVADPYVKPADRKIITMATIAGATTGVLFNAASKNSFDSAVLAALSTNPATSATDSLADQRIDWLRGVRTNEVNSSGGTLRLRSSIMGDVINSGPVYKQDANRALSGAGYPAFARSVQSRTAMVYFGANDGMLHGLRASDGKELLAYIPRAVAPMLNRLTNPAYRHQPYVDGVPLVDEAQVGSSWKTLLVSGMGGGAQGVFALDVTDPEAFGVNNVLFEFTDANDPDMGNVMTQPTLVKLKVPGATAAIPATYKWFVAVGSGYNNYKVDGAASSTSAQALFFLSVDKAPGEPWALGTNYFKVVLPVASTSIANGLSNPAVVTGPTGVATLLYAGDLQGNLWKFDLGAGISTSNLSSSVFQAASVRTPLFVAASGGARQPITTTPQVVEANATGYMVVFGTGKFVEPADLTSTAQQSIYGIWDSLETTAASFTVPGSALYARPATLSGSSVILGTGTFTFGKDDGEYRGWSVNLPETRERVAVESALGVGAVIFNAAIPLGACTGDGSGRTYCLNPVNGSNVCDGNPTATPGIPSAGKLFVLELDASSYSARRPTGQRTVSIEQQSISSSTKLTAAGNVVVSGQKLVTVTLPAGRMSWRELRN